MDDLTQHAVPPGGFAGRVKNEIMAHAAINDIADFQRIIGIGGGRSQFEK